MTFSLSIFSVRQINQEAFLWSAKDIGCRVRNRNWDPCCSRRTTLPTMCLCFSAQPLCKHS